MALPKIAAYGFLIPFGLFLLALAGRAAIHGHMIRTTWPLTDARVVAADQKKAVTLEFTWNHETVRKEVPRAEGFSFVSRDDKLKVYVNPADLASIRRASTDSMWNGVVVTSVFGVLLLGVAGLLIWMETSPVFDLPKEDDWMARQVAEMQKFEATARAQHPESGEAAPRPDDGSEIVVHEPGESWKANVFWGLLFGLLLAVPPLFAGDDLPGWKKVGMIALGLGWMAFMARSAIQNRGRSIRCDSTTIEVRQPFGSRSIPLHEVRKIVRTDVRRNLRAIDDFGRSKTRTRGLDTMPSIVIYTLHDADGKELLRFGKDMKPAGELDRLLTRLEEHSQTKVVEE